uniref:Vint domain-containing protein n=1 Tax=viral metagenome TaxID=1070528 RepID=A0A6C0I6S9_9ZZZZ
MSIPLAILIALFSVIVAVLSKMFHLSPVSVPKQCFDKNTKFTMYNGEIIKISDIKPGDILSDNTRITATMKLDLNNSRMFSLQGVIVSESHWVKYNGRWIYVKDHPEAIEIHGYKEPYIYCINTNTKDIIINGLEFLDWDDLYEAKLERVLKHIKQKPTTHNYIDIHRNLDKGFKSDFVVELIDSNKYIKDIKIGDMLKSGGEVYGLVEIDGSDLHIALGNSENLYHLLTTTQYFISNGQIFNDYNYIIDSIVSDEK